MEFIKRGEERKGQGRRALLRLLLGSAACWAVFDSRRSVGAPVHGPSVEVQKRELRARVDRVRQAVRDREPGSFPYGTEEQMAQWYNWGDWNNGFNNQWLNG